MNWFKSAFSQSTLKREQKKCNALYREQAPRLFRCLLAKGHLPSLAEEVLNEAFLVYWEKFHAPVVLGEEPPKSLEEPHAWLLRVAHNKAIDARRRAIVAQEAQNRLEEGASSQVLLRDEPLIHREMLYQVFELLGKRDTELLTLRDLKGLSYDEIAQQLSLEKGSIGTLLRRARKSFHDKYQELLDDALTSNKKVG